MRLPVDNAVGSPCSKSIGNKENVEPEVIGSSESSAAANLLWLLDFRLDNLLPNDGNCAEKMANNQGKCWLDESLSLIESIYPIKLSIIYQWGDGLMRRWMSRAFTGLSFEVIAKEFAENGI